MIFNRQIYLAEIQADYINLENMVTGDFFKTKPFVSLENHKKPNGCLILKSVGNTLHEQEGYKSVYATSDRPPGILDSDALVSILEFGLKQLKQKNRIFRRSPGVILHFFPNNPTDLPGFDPDRETQIELIEKLTGENGMFRYVYIVRGKSKFSKTQLFEFARNPRKAPD